MVCAAIGTTLVLIGLTGLGDMAEAFALIGASVAFTAAAIFLVMHIVFRRSGRMGSTYQPLSRNDRPDET